MGEQPAHIGEHEVMDLGLVVDGGLDLGEGVFQIPMLKAKERAARSCLIVAGPFPSESQA